MCLGIPGQLVERVDEDEDLGPGDWALIHVGLVMPKIDEAEADRALEGLELLGQSYAEAVDAIRESQVAAQ